VSIKKTLKKILIKLLHSNNALAKKVYYTIKVLIEKENEIVSYVPEEDIKVLQFIRGIKKEIKILIEDEEAMRLFSLVKSTAKINGDIAEVGIYEGGSAKIICEAKGDKTLHLFDTFTGLPNVTDIDEGLKNGDYSSNYEKVKDYLDYSNVHIYKGLFPDTAEPIKNKKFSLVNLDVDTYQSTKDCLEFFYDRMNKGGIIISHDCNRLMGVKKAINDFFKDKETIIRVSLSQCLIIKNGQN